MTDGFEGSFTLNSAFTKEDWDKIADVEMEKTKSVTFSTPSGREVKYISVEVLQEIRQEIEEWGKDACVKEHGCGDEVLEIIDKHIKEITNEECD